ncbi:hypothetical protein G5B30_16745 [Sphingobacterium sp. SGG-5]|uniref:hypothetical protein n=1 Tax=Sphingobacterium sp. SGG-5 TaxID=2710881 RepID=UPI0013EA6E13|nr:hypothetical protein [Sphingobacterium sp. SGG-5]NGM63559.1 hypothetical protein [Sphingobacterium sp. SGG-5]
MAPFIKIVSNVLTEVFTTFLESDMKVISNDAEKLLSDKDNKRAYIDGLAKLRQLEKDGNKEPKVTIILKNKQPLELTR